MERPNPIRGIDIPLRMASRPKDERGYPVPWFVANVAGAWDFRVIEAGRFNEAITRQRCWLCGNRYFGGAAVAFVIGPMCAVNRITAEPPCHIECAEFAVRACPFLVNPKMVRSPRAMPDGHQEPVGIHNPRNPGVALLWITCFFDLFRVDNGYLIQLGDPEEIRAYREGRKATRTEVLASIESGYPALEAAAREDGREGLEALHKARANAEALLPAD